MGSNNGGALTETVIEGETGWLAGASDVPAWTAAIEKALLLTPSEKDRLALAGRGRVEALYDLSHMIAATLAVYDEAVLKK